VILQAPLEPLRSNRHLTYIPISARENRLAFIAGFRARTRDDEKIEEAKCCRLDSVQNECDFFLVAAAHVAYTAIDNDRRADDIVARARGEVDRSTRHVFGRADAA